jgi:hypothetical protein
LKILILFESNNRIIHLSISSSGFEKTETTRIPPSIEPKFDTSRSSRALNKGARNENKTRKTNEPTNKPKIGGDRINCRTPYEIPAEREEQIKSLVA